MKRTDLSVLILGFFAVLTLLLLYGCGGTGESEAVTSDRDPSLSDKPECVVAQTRTFTRLVTASGVLEAEHDAYVTAQVPGRIGKIAVRLGEGVQKGESLASLADSTYFLDRDLKSAQLKELDRNYQQAKELFGKGLVSKTELENAQTKYEVGRIGLAIAEDKLRQSLVVAPFDGLVAEIRARNGQGLEPGDSLFRITQTFPLFARLFLPESLLQYLRPGLPALVWAQAYSQTKLRAKVSQIGRIINPVGGTVEVQIVLVDAQAKHLGPGMSISVEIAAGTRQVTALGENEVTLLGTNPEEERIIARVISGGKSSTRTLELGSKQKGWVEIFSGLFPGDTVSLSFDRQTSK